MDEEIVAFLSDNLVVTPPIMSGVLEKRGFRFRKKWARRWVKLSDFTLSYYTDVEWPGGDLRGSITLTKNSSVEDNGDELFTVHPGALGSSPWTLKAETTEIKNQWLDKLKFTLGLIRHMNSLKVMRVLGTGGFGIVRQVEDLTAKRMIAVKEIRIDSSKAKHEAEHEIAVLEKISSMVDHPNVVKIYQIYVVSESISVAMQHCSGGELYDRIVARKRFTERDAAHVLKQLIGALKELHSHNILHLDIKPENILYANESDDSPIVLTDFGLSKVLQSVEVQGTNVSGTVGYTAPEIITSKLYSPAADVFAAGVVLFIMLAGYPPFRDPGGDDARTLLKIVTGHFEMPARYWDSVSVDAKNLVTHMLFASVEGRVSVDEVLAHPWVTQMAPDVPLPDSQARLGRYNTERRTTSMLSALNRMIPRMVIGPPPEGTTSLEDAKSRMFTLSDQNMKVMRLVFDALGDSQARLSYRAFYLLCYHMGAVAFPSSMREIFDRMDEDNCGRVTFDQYVKGTLELVRVTDEMKRFLFVFYAAGGATDTFRMEEYLAECGSGSPHPMPGHQSSVPVLPILGGIKQHLNVGPIAEEGSEWSGDADKEEEDIERDLSLADIAAFSRVMSSGGDQQSVASSGGEGGTHTMGNGGSGGDDNSGANDGLGGVMDDISLQEANNSERVLPVTGSVASFNSVSGEEEGGAFSAPLDLPRVSPVPTISTVTLSNEEKEADRLAKLQEYEVVDVDSLYMTADTIVKALRFISDLPGRRLVDVSGPTAAADVFRLLSPDGLPLSFQQYKARMWDAPILVAAATSGTCLAFFGEKEEDDEEEASTSLVGGGGNNDDASAVPGRKCDFLALIKRDLRQFVHE